MGFTHRGAVLVVYGIAILFSLIALLLNVSSRLGGVLLMIGLAFALEVFIEGLEIWGVGRTPLFDTLTKVQCTALFHRRGRLALRAPLRHRAQAEAVHWRQRQQRGRAQGGA